MIIYITSGCQQYFHMLAHLIFTVKLNTMLYYTFLNDEKSEAKRY